MRIESSDVQWNMRHSASSSLSQSLRISLNAGRPLAATTQTGTSPHMVALAQSVLLSLSSAAAAASAASSDVALSGRATGANGTPASATDATQAVSDADDSGEPTDPYLRLAKSIIERMTGQRIHTVTQGDLRGHHGHHRGEGRDMARASPGISVEARSVYTEHEQTAVQGSATVHTADGKDITVSIDLQMARSYREESSLTLRTGGGAAAKDPLVFNFGGQAAALSDQTFNFDLDGDGTDEHLAQLASDSGYLAIDVNGNGQIDSGKELFGPATGQGFQELAAYDQDGNGWIDEGDAVFSRLQIWKPADASLQSAASLGIGAISLATVESPFALKSASNQTLGAVRSTGLYLMENGSAGTVQQIDLAV